MSDIAFRRPAPEEVADFIAVSIRSYGSDDSADRLPHELLSNEIDRSIGAFSDGRCVGGGGAFSIEVTMPGGATLPAAGVTMIGVEPTHRRRGILTGLLRHLHEDATERGEPIAVLTASETSIYRRFGYGVAAEVTHLSIAADKVRFDPPVLDTGSFELVDPHRDTTDLESVFDHARRTRTGWLSLTPGMWAQTRDDPDWGRDGATPLRAVVHRDASGNPDGHALWRIEARRDPDRLAGNTLHIEQLTTADPEVEAALWEFLAGIDLVTTVSWDVGPVDPMIRWRLVEPRQLRTHARADMVWARLLDVEAALSARTYGTSGSLTFVVADRFHPELGGRYRLSCPGRGELGRCERIGDVGTADAADELSVDTADLASITLGGVAPSMLADAGRLVGPPFLVDTADALFTVPRRPWFPIEF